MKVILDASALLAWLQVEPGAMLVEETLAESGISTLNFSEVVQKSLAQGINVVGLYEDIITLGIKILPFEAIDAEQAARIWLVGNHLSLADRACLALGIRLNLPVLTTDRAWLKTNVGADVRLIR